MNPNDKTKSILKWMDAGQMAAKNGGQEASSVHFHEEVHVKE